MVDSSKKTREATYLRGLAISRLSGSRVPIHIDPQTGRVQTLIVNTQFCPDENEKIIKIFFIFDKFLDLRIRKIKMK